ncbi:MAG: PAS domain-containing protein [Chloroflexi bacterium]|nr:PAS domain-containing protein [Chloroflexota bacterium]
MIQVNINGQFSSADLLLLSVLKSIVDPLLILDNRQRVVLMNTSAEAVFGETSEQAAGRTLSEVVRSDDLVALLDDTGKPLAEWVNSDNRTFAPRVEVVRGDNGQPEGWIVVLRDITQYKKLNRNQSEFTRIVSHDLRSPLTSMQGFASMLELGLVGELNEKQLHFVNKILAGITQMTALVDNIQDAGRYDPETGFYEVNRAPCDLGEIVRRIVENHLVPAEKELDIQVKIAEDLPIINADSNMLERAIINLVDNAIKYTPSGGSVTVEVKNTGKQVLVMVKDSGLGISPEHQKNLFERHVRIPRQEHKKIKGSGLGLFIVRSVAQRHGGSAWVESQENSGSTFYLSIPLEGANLVAPQS